VPITIGNDPETTPGKTLKHPQTKSRRWLSHQPVWFAFGDDPPLAFFAGIWRRWTSTRKVKEGETTNDIFVFLTTEPNARLSPN